LSFVKKRNGRLHSPRSGDEVRPEIPVPDSRTPLPSEIPFGNEKTGAWGGLFILCFRPNLACAAFFFRSFLKRHSVADLTICVKGISTTQTPAKEWAIPYLPEWSGAIGLTLRDFVAGVVRAEVRALNELNDQRQQERLFRLLTADQIAEKAKQGKVEMGGRSAAVQPIDANQAVAQACQALEKGTYLVLIDGQDYRNLDAEIALRPDSQVMFLRLTLLTGG
jgi:hypothetical protein